MRTWVHLGVLTLIVGYTLAGGKAEAAAGRLALEQPKLALHRGSVHGLFAEPLTLDATHLIEAALPADDGSGGGRGRVFQGKNRPIIGFLLGLLVGFGVGHLAMNDSNGFVMWLVIDVAVIAVAVVFWAILPPVGALATLGFLVERVLQGLDAYEAGGGEHWVERSYEGAIFARAEEGVSPTRRFSPVPRVLRLAFGP